MNRLTIALAQWNVGAGCREDNLARALRLAGEASSAADILLLPELWLDGYDLENAHRWASAVGEGGFAHMRDIARRHSLHVAGSVLERHAGGVSNTAALYSPDGALLGLYRKIHLFRPMQEDRHLVPGDHATLCQTPWGPVGLAICYDLRFPELFRTMALAGAVLILLPAQWPARRIEAWSLLARARAVENEFFFAACNRVGRDADTVFPGRSLVVDPWGNVLAQGDDREQIVMAQADLQEVQAARRHLTVYEDRRPLAYHISNYEAN